MKNGLRDGENSFHQTRKKNGLTNGLLIGIQDSKEERIGATNMMKIWKLKNIGANIGTTKVK